VAQSWVLGQVVDRAVTPRFESGQLRAGVAVAAACAIVAVGLVKTVGIITRRIAATLVHANVQATLRERLAQRYHRLPLTWHHEHRRASCCHGPRATWRPPRRSCPRCRSPPVC
jgi:ATP-binding cassette subfamily B protein